MRFAYQLGGIGLAFVLCFIIATCFGRKGTGIGSMFHAACVHVGCLSRKWTMPNPERLRGLARLARAARRLRGSPSPAPTPLPEEEDGGALQPTSQIVGAAAAAASHAVSPWRDIQEIGYEEAPPVTSSQSAYWCCHKGDPTDLNSSLWQANNVSSTDGADVGCCPKFLRSKAPRTVAAGCGVPALITMCVAAVALSSQYDALTSIYWTRFEVIDHGTNISWFADNNATEMEAALLLWRSCEVRCRTNSSL